MLIIKCQAHKKGVDFITKGNSAADEAAKVASDSCRAIQSVLSMPEAAPTEDDIVRMQEKTGVDEPKKIKKVGLKRGAVCTSTGLWGTHDGM